MTLNILMPLAGAGQRFKEAGYEILKPLIPLDNVPMWEAVRDNVMPRTYDARFILLGQQDFVRQAQTRTYDSVVCVSKLTQGAACTVLRAEHLLDSYDPLLIVNGDQIIEGLDIDAFLDFARFYDGCIMTFKVPYGEPPKWSYAAVGPTGNVLEVAEKDPISINATCGLYWFRHGREFLRAAHAMITKDVRTNGEFYLCPVYNEMISGGAKIGAWDVCEHGARMWGIGTPEDLEKFLARRRPIERAAAGVA